MSAESHHNRQLDAEIQIAEELFNEIAHGLINRPCNHPVKQFLRRGLDLARALLCDLQRRRADPAKGFCEWSSHQSGRGDPIGGLARAALADWSFPWRATEIPGIREYIKSLYARDRSAAFAAFDEATQQYAGPLRGGG